MLQLLLFVYFVLVSVKVGFKIRVLDVSQIALKYESTNQHDEYAIKVNVAGIQRGYVAKNECRELRDWLDRYSGDNTPLTFQHVRTEVNPIDLEQLFNPTPRAIILRAVLQEEGEGGAQ